MSWVWAVWAQIQADNSDLDTSAPVVVSAAAGGGRGDTAVPSSARSGRLAAPDVELDLCRPAG